MSFRRFTLYHYPVTRSARVKWLLHELLGDDFEVRRVQLFEGEQYRPDYLALNPNHCVPTLEIELDDGRSMRMIESGAMIAFLADAFPDKGLAPPVDGDPMARADYLQMLHFASTWVDMMLWQIRIHRDVLPEADRDPRQVERYTAKLANEVTPQFEARLREHPFVCGETFSAADCLVAHDVAWGRNYGVFGERVFSAYLGRVAKRPAWQAAFADRGEFHHEADGDDALQDRFSG